MYRCPTAVRGTACLSSTPGRQTSIPRACGYCSVEPQTTDQNELWSNRTGAPPPLSHRRRQGGTVPHRRRDGGGTHALPSLSFWSDPYAVNRAALLACVVRVDIFISPFRQYTVRKPTMYLPFAFFASCCCLRCQGTFPLAADKHADAPRELVDAQRASGVKSSEFSIVRCAARFFVFCVHSVPPSIGIPTKNR